MEQAQRLRMLLRLELVARSALNERIRKFKDLAVLRPDGYLAQALTGAPLQCVGPVQVQGSELQAGDFKVGPFYTQEGGSFREEPSIPPRAAFLSGAESSAQPK